MQMLFLTGYDALKSNINVTILNDKVCFETVDSILSFVVPFKCLSKW